MSYCAECGVWIGNAGRYTRYCPTCIKKKRESGANLRILKMVLKLKVVK